MKFKTKIILILTILTAFPVVLSSIFNLTRSQNQFRENILSQRLYSVSQESQTIKDFLNLYQDKVLTASKYPPIQGLIRSKKTGIDPKDGSTYQDWHKRLIDIFSSITENDPNITQFRYIDNTGQEIVRVDRKNDHTYVVEELQNKADRYYFAATARLKGNQIYVSPLDLNIEFNQIEIPDLPVIRFATPVYSQTDNSFQGIVIINTITSNLLNNLQRTDQGTIMLINKDGNYISHPDIDKKFGSQLPNKDNFFDTFPQFPQLLNGPGQGTYESGNNIFIWQKIFYNPSNLDDFWVIITEVNTNQIFQPLYQNQIITLVITVASILIGIFIFSIVINILLNPLNQLFNAFKDISMGKYDIQLPTNNHNEFGFIFSSFNQMSHALVESRKQVDQKVEQRTQDLKKFQLAVDFVSDHIIITDPEGIIIYANPAASTITGFSNDEILGQKAGSKELWGGLMERKVYENLWKTIKYDKKIYVGELKNKRKNGDIYIAETKISPVLNDNGDLLFFVGIERDITKAKEVDRMKTEFISLASHQLRTPLSAMKWFLEILLDGDVGKLTSDQQDAVKNINESNDRMIALVNALLNISRIESGRIMISPQPTDLKQLIKGIYQELKPQIENKKLKLSLSFDSKIDKINLDPKLIAEVYKNLLVNSIKYTPPNGEISLTVTTRDNDIVSQITDNGYGIPQGDQSKIFTKFFRADNVVKLETEGTGLGLYMTKAIIDSSQGKIWFESQENKGTTFWFTLPATGMKPKEGDVTLSSTIEGKIAKPQKTNDNEKQL